MSSMEAVRLNLPLTSADLGCPRAGKQHYSRKDSADSGISGNMSRKTSTVSQLSCSSIAEEPTEETIKEETTVFVEPDDDLCEKITQQVRLKGIVSRKLVGGYCYISLDKPFDGLRTPSKHINFILGKISNLQKTVQHM